MNIWIGIGNLVRDVELKQTQNGTAVANYTIAINRPSRQDSDTETDYINVISFGKQAENLARYTSKGRKIAVQGRIQVRHYQNAEGKNVYVTEILANNVQFLDTKTNNNVEPKPEQDPFQQMANTIEEEQSGMDMPW